MPNYKMMQAFEAYNADQVMTQTMYYIELEGNCANIDGLKNVQIYGKGFTLPNRTNEFADVSYRGYPIPTPTVLRMENSHTIDIIADADGQLRAGFLRWQAAQIDPLIKTQGFSFGSDRRPTEGAGGNQIAVNLLAPDYQTIETTVRIFGVRVESVGGITLSNEDGGIASFQVGFRSIYWEADRSQNAGAGEDESKAGGGNYNYAQIDAGQKAFGYQMNSATRLPNLQDPGFVGPPAPGA